MLDALAQSKASVTQHILCAIVFHLRDCYREAILARTISKIASTAGRLVQCVEGLRCDDGVPVNMLDTHQLHYASESSRSLGLRTYEPISNCKLRQGRLTSIL
jgi:hypothetical protein